jgi:hypothetical protein
MIGPGRELLRLLRLQLPRSEHHTKACARESAVLVHLNLMLQLISASERTEVCWHKSLSGR